MNIKDKIREALLNEVKNNREEYGCVLFDLKVDMDKWKEIQDMIDQDDIYQGSSKVEGFGGEQKPHVTLLYGIHTDVPDEDVEKLIDEIKSPKIRLGKITSFEQKEFDVLKFDVESKDLMKLNKVFKKLPHTETYSYHPHTTLAYVKKGKAAEYIEKMGGIEPLQVSIDQVEYSKADKSKKKYDIK